MLSRIFFFLLGFGLTIVGMVHIICYLNLLTVGYTLKEYVNYIIRQIECLYAFLGVIIMILTIYIPKGEKNELYI